MRRPIDEVIGANLFDLTPAHEIDQIRSNVARLSARGADFSLRPFHRAAGRRGDLAGVGRPGTARRVGPDRGLSVGRPGHHAAQARRAPPSRERAQAEAGAGGRSAGRVGAGFRHAPDQDRSRARALCSAARRGLRARHERRAQGLSSGRPRSGAAAPQCRRRGSRPTPIGSKRGGCAPTVRSSGFPTSAA